MRPGVVVAAALLALALPGCFGVGCFPDGHRLLWQQDGVFAAIGARHDPADVNRTIQWQGVAPGLPFNGTLPPAPAGNVSLASAGFFWGGSWSGHVQARATREGTLVITALYDSGDRKASVRGRLGSFVDAVSDAPASEQAATVEALLSEWDPRSNDIKLSGEAPLPSALRLEDAFAAHGSAWAAGSPGNWDAGEEGWRFEAQVATWTLRLHDFKQQDIVADAAGAVGGPVLDVEDPGDEPPADVPALQELTRAVFADQGLPQPVLDDARPIVARRVCVD